MNNDILSFNILCHLKRKQ